MLNEYIVVFEDDDGNIHDDIVEATDAYMARDVIEAIMDADGIKGSIIEVTKV